MNSSSVSLVVSPPEISGKGLGGGSTTILACTRKIPFPPPPTKRIRPTGRISKNRRQDQRPEASPTKTYEIHIENLVRLLREDLVHDTCENVQVAFRNKKGRYTGVYTDKRSKWVPTRMTNLFSHSRQGSSKSSFGKGPQISPARIVRLLCFLE